MRTTVDIPDGIYRKLKTRAARQGRSVKELIVRGVEKELGVTGRRVTLPIVRSKRPAALRLTNARVYDLVPFS